MTVVLIAAAMAVSATAGATSAVAAVSSGNPSSTQAGDTPEGLAYSPDGAHLYVANFGAGDISDIDPATGQVMATIVTTGVAPTSVVFSPDGFTAYAASWNDGEIAVIDVATATETFSLTGIGTASDIAISPDGFTLYVAEYSNNSLAVYDLAGASPSLTTRVAVGANPTNIAVSHFGDRVYVVNYATSTFSTIDATTNAVLATTNTGTNPWDVAISPDGSWLAISHETSHEIHLHDLVTSTSTVIPLVSQSYGVTFSPDSTHLFATIYVPNMVAEIDLTANNAFTAHTLTVAGSGPHSIAMSPSGCQIAVTGTIGDIVQYLDASPCMGPPASASGGAVTEQLAATGSDGVATLAWSVGAVLALLAGASILILRRNKSASEFRR